MIAMIMAGLKGTDAPIPGQWDLSGQAPKRKGEAVSLGCLWRKTMKDDIGSVFKNADAADRIKQCRENAAEAQRLADTAASPEARADYLKLRSQWEALASEMETFVLWIKPIQRLDS